MLKAEPASGSGQYPSTLYAACVIAILFVVTLVSQLDRQLPALMVKAIRTEFGVSDTAFSLLQGYAFGLVYTLAGLPLGRWVDRHNRVNLIVTGLLVWSAMTLLSGFAQSYWQLFALRMGVGIGEACLAPAAYSIISDCVPSHQRGRALGVYYVSLAIGSGASLYFGGLILKLIPHAGLNSAVGNLAQWQLAFIIAGAPGLVLALLMLTVREPDRIESRGGDAQSQQVSLREVWGHLRTNAGAFSAVLFYPGTIAIIGYGALSWAPALLERRFHWTPANAGLALGPLVAVSGLVGTLISGFLSDRWAAKRIPAARLRVALTSFLLLCPASIVWALAPTPNLCLALLALVIAAGAMAQAAAPVIVQELAPNRMRGQLIALYLLIGGLLGLGLGPLAIAMITDHVFHQDGALPFSIALVGGPTALAGAWLCLSGLSPYAAAYAKQQRLPPRLTSVVAQQVRESQNEAEASP